MARGAGPFHLYKPGPPLSEFVDFFWIYEGYAPPHRGERLLPTGTSELVFSVDANPNDPQELAIAFQGLNDGGVQTSANGGLTWSNEPVPPTRYDTVRFAPDGTLYAISDGPSSVAPGARSS